MALRKKELNSRRQEKPDVRQEKAVRGLAVKLIIASLAIFLCGILVLAVGLNYSGPSLWAPPDPGTPEPSPTVPEPTEPTTVIHFAAAGDLTVSDRVVASQSGEQGFAPVFQDVLPLLAQADLTAVNFEGNLVGGDYGSSSMSAPQSLMEALADAGVDLVQMANSYAIHNGMSGLADTLDGIRDAGMEPVGAYASNAEFRESGGYTIRDVNGVRVAVVAFTKGMGSMALPEGSEDCVNTLYRDYATTYRSVDTAGITGIMRAVERQSPDIVIALVHWGSEYNDQISASQDTIRDLLLSLGADAIIGTHSHLVQGIEYDSENGTLVAYSLGDFLSDGQTAGTQYSIVLDLEITKDNRTGNARITGYSYTPIYNVHEAGQPLRLMRILPTMAAYESGYLYRVSRSVYEDMSYALTRVEARVQG